MSETPPKKRTIRLQVINESGDMTTISATRSASVDEVIELLTLGAQDILPNAPSAAISIFLKKNGTWEEEVKRGTNLSDYKQLKKKTARIKVILDPEVMKKIHDEISHKENEKIYHEIPQRHHHHDGICLLNYLYVSRLVFIEGVLV